MRDFSKRIKTNAFISALFCVVLGLILLIWPGAAISVLNTLLGAVLAIAGAIDIVLFLSGHDNTLYGLSRLIIGIILVVFGIWVMVRPSLLAVIIPRVIGTLICVHGIADIGRSVTLRRSAYPGWLAALIMGLLTVALGVLLIFKPLGSFVTVLRFIGAFLVYDGASDVWILSRISKMKKQAKADAKTEADALDVEFEEVEDPGEDDKNQK